MVTFSPSEGTLDRGVQAEYPLVQGVGFEGLEADTGPFDVISVAPADGVEIPFGSLVALNGSGKLKVVDSASDIPIGIARRDNTFEAVINADGRPCYPANRTVGVVTKGRIYVYSEDGVTLGAAARVRHDAVTDKPNGRFAGAAVAGETALIANTIYRTGSTGAGLVVVEVNFPTGSLTADTI